MVAGRRRGRARRTGSFAPLPTARSDPSVSVITQFQTGHGWSNNGASTFDLNATAAGHTIGSQCAWFQSLGTGVGVGIRRTGMSPIDMTGKLFGVLLRIDDPSLLFGSAALSLDAGNSTFANFIRFRMDSDQLQQYWNQPLAGGNFSGMWRYVIVPWEPTHSASGWSTKTGAQTDAQIRANITDLQIRFADESGDATTRVSVQEIFTINEQTTYSNGVVCFRFDDNRSGAYDYARTILSGVGASGSLFVLPSLLGAAGYMSAAQLAELQNAYGWDVCCHAYDSAMHAGDGYPQHSSSEIAADIRSSQSWLRGQGFNGYPWLAYPHGNHSYAASGRVMDRVDEVAAANVRAAFTINERWPATLPVADRTVIPSYPYITGPNTIAEIQGQIDLIRSCKGAGVVTLHQLVDGTGSPPKASTEWYYQDFQTLVNYCVAQGVAIRKVSQVF